MKQFRFPLASVMSWRERVAEQEKSSLERLLTVRSELEQERAAVTAELNGGDSQESELTGADLHRIGLRRVALVHRDHQILERQAQCEQRIGSQREKCVTADRNHRLLTKIFDTRHAAWRAQLDRELQESATDSYLANWIRNKG